MASPDNVFIRKMICSLDFAEFGHIHRLLKIFPESYEQTFSTFYSFCICRYGYAHVLCWLRTISDECPELCLYTFRSVMEEMCAERTERISDDKSPKCIINSCEAKCRMYKDGWFISCSRGHTDKHIQRLYKTVLVCPICMKEMVAIPQLTNNNHEPHVFKCANQHLNIKSASKT